MTLPHHHYRPIIFALLAFALLSACRELVTDNFPDTEQVPTVNSILAAGQPIALHLSLSGKIDSTHLPTIDNADIALYVNDVYTENLVPEGNGIYTSTVVVAPQTTYRCQISVPNTSPISCSTTIPARPTILQLQHQAAAGIDDEGLTYPAIDLTFANTPGQLQHYEVDMQLIDGNDTHQAQVYNPTDEVLLAESLPILTFGNSLINSDTYTMHINYKTGSSHTVNGGMQTKLYPLLVELRAVSVEYYQFKRQLYLYEEGRYPYVVGGVVLASQMYSNIEGGYGIFAGYAATETAEIDTKN